MRPRHFIIKLFFAENPEADLVHSLSRLFHCRISNYDGQKRRTNRKSHGGEYRIRRADDYRGIEQIGGILTGDPVTRAEGDFNVAVGSEHQEMNKNLTAIENEEAERRESNESIHTEIKE